MFPRSYFAGSYFAPTYFPPVTDTVPVPVPETGGHRQYRRPRERFDPLVRDDSDLLFWIL